MNSHAELANRLGLRLDDVAEIVGVLKAFPNVKQAKVFGSRAKGTQRNGSDVDLSVFGDGLTHDDILGISGTLNEETRMPYFFDVVDATHLTHQDLLEHIEQVGVEVLV